MSQFDMQYNELIHRIDREGVWNTGQKVSTKWKDGTPAYAKSVFFHTMTFHPNEVPILTTKFNSPKTAMNEAPFWIWRKSNNVEELREVNGTKRTVWDEWEREDKTIGKAYGYQLGKKVMKIGSENVDQVDYVLHQLRFNPASRRIITELWNIDDLTDMALPPCVHHTQWDTYDGRLNLLVKARSSDVGLGLPFNVFQYAVLHRMFARHAGLPLGVMHFVLGNVHIYDRHMPKLFEQTSREPYHAPKLYMHPNIKSFYDFTPEDIRLIDYQHHGKLDLEIAVHG